MATPLLSGTCRDSQQKQAAGPTGQCHGSRAHLRAWRPPRVCDFKSKRPENEGEKKKEVMEGLEKSQGSLLSRKHETLLYTQCSEDRSLWDTPQL